MESKFWGKWAICSIRKLSYWLAVIYSEKNESLIWIVCIRITDTGGVVGHFFLQKCPAHLNKTIILYPNVKSVKLRELWIKIVWGINLNKGPKAFKSGNLLNDCSKTEIQYIKYVSKNFMLRNYVSGVTNLFRYEMNFIILRTLKSPKYFI